MDRVFATAKPGTAYVFRHNFSGNKWENVTNRKDGWSAVTFRKRGDKFSIRIAPEGGEKEEYQISHNAQIKDSGDGFIQVPLPDKKQLIGIKFKQKEEAPIFLGKIRAEMDIQGGVTMQAVVLDEKPATMPLNPALLPKAIVYGGSPQTLQTASSQQAPPPPQEHYGNLPAASIEPAIAKEHFSVPPASGQPANPYSGPTASGPDQYDGSLAAGRPVNQYSDSPISGQSINQYAASGRPVNQYPVAQPVAALAAVFNARSDVIQPGGSPGFMPGPSPNRPQPARASRAMVAMAGGQEVIQTRPAVAPALQAPPPNMRPPVRAEPDVPSFSGDEVKSDHAVFLANAINVGDFEAAHRVINMLQKVTLHKKKPGKKMNISYVDGVDPAAEDVDVTLNLEIEFQSQHKSMLRLYLDFKASMTIAMIQQQLELSHHIPKATQNWIISNQLVRGEQLHKSLREFGIDGRGTTARVFIYVMHSKKAQVPKEEYEAIRQCQQEERERKKQGLKPPWQMSAHTDLPFSPPHPDLAMTQSPPTIPPRTGMPAGQDYHQPQPQPRRQAWPEGEDIYSRTRHAMPEPRMGPPPVRQQAQHDPTYEELQGYQQHPGEGRYYPPHQVPSHHPAPTLPTGGGFPPNTIHSRPPQPNTPPAPQLQPAGYPQEFHQQPHLHHQLPPQPPPHHPPPPQPLQQSHPPPPQQRHPPPPQPRRATPPPPARQIGWSCLHCTYINKPRRPGCEICGAERPENYKVPDDIPLDEDEARIMRGLQGSDHMFQEYEEQEKRRRERERVENFQALLQAEEEEALVTNDKEFDCPVCLVPIDPGEGVRLRGCLHQFCKDCLAQSIMASPDAEVKCPFIDNDYQCNIPLPEREIKQLVSAEQLQELYKRALREAENAAANSYHCKTTDCEGFCFYEDEVNEFNCPLCNKVNCLTCKAIHEGMNCQEYQDDLRRRAANDVAAKATQEMLDQLLEAGDAMNCPSCKIVVQKKDGCDWIRCSVCKTEICWATKQARWGPKGKGDTSGGCHCREKGKKCHPLCRNCH